MNVLEMIVERYGAEGGLIYPTGFEDAVIGFEEDSNRLIVSKKKCIELMVQRDDMNVEDALEHYYFNMVGTKGSVDGMPYPIYCDDFYD